MALARSASGPGGLSINTGAANTLFGAASQPPPSGGLFGSASASKPAGGLFGSTATTSAPQTQSMFGATAASSSSGGVLGSTATAAAQPQSGGLFGSSTTTSQAPQSGGLFGSSTATSQAPQTGGLFGSTTATQPPQTGGLFGSAAATSQPAQSGGLFGSMATSQPQQSGGLFGNPTTTSQPQQSGGLFNTTSQPQQTTSLFGQSTPAAGTSTSQPAQNTSLFGNKSLFGAPAAQPQSSSQFSLNKPQQQSTSSFGTQTVIPGVRIDVSNLRSTTRFNDLAEDLQKELEIIDKFILLQIQHSNDCAAILPSHGDQLDFVPDNVEYLSRKLLGLESSLSSDAEAVALLNKFVNTDADNARLSFTVIENLKLPPQYHQSGIWHAASAPTPQSTSTGDGNAQDLVSFFSKTADEMSETLSTYQRSVGEIEQHMRGLEISMGQAVQHVRQQSPAAQVSELVGVLKDFELGILGVAGHVGEAREHVQRLQLGGFVDPPKDETAVNGKKPPRRGVY